MATIKEVAQYAGVSVGTVSNVLNGNTNNAKLIALVESAMKELDYRPDANARSLKNTKSNLIAVILPNVTHPDLQTLLYTLELELREKGYHLLLKISQNNPILERQCIEQCLEQRVEGLIIFSGSNPEGLASLLKGMRPVVWISKRSSHNFMANSILIDYKKALDDALSRLKARGVDEIGLILERDVIKESQALDIYHKHYTQADHVRVVDFSKERGFKAAYELLYHHDGIKAVITGNQLIAEGTRKAIELLGRGYVAQITFKEQNWIEDEGRYEATIGVPFRKIGECAVKKLTGAIDSPHTYEGITEQIEAEYTETAPLLEQAERSGASGTATLRFAMFDCPAAQSLRMLSQLYTQQTGVHIEFEMLKYNELKDKLYSTGPQSGGIDGFMMDITWVEGLAKNGIAEPLDELQAGYDHYFADFVPGMVKEYGVQDGKLYGIPFMSGTQLLFYQKDLFENANLKRLFKRQYGEELAAPATWAEFNLTAEFFTKEYNERSPVKYGLSAVQGANVYTAISFLNRLWAYGSDVFSEDGQVMINNSNSLAALKSLTKCYRFVSADACTTWDDVVESFKTGDSAMVVLYDSHAVEINDYTKSKVAGNIGYSLIPGKAPVLGGWSAGVDASSANKKAAADFWFWACGNQSAIPNSLLGGTTLRQDYYTRRDLENLYPWKSLLLDSYRISHKRLVPAPYRDWKHENDIYNFIIAQEINKAILGQSSEEEALDCIERRLHTLLTP